MLESRLTFVATFAGAFAYIGVLTGNCYGPLPGHSHDPSDLPARSIPSPLVGTVPASGTTLTPASISQDPLMPTWLSNPVTEPELNPAPAHSAYFAAALRVSRLNYDRFIALHLHRL